MAVREKWKVVAKAPLPLELKIRLEPIAQEMPEISPIQSPMLCGRGIPSSKPRITKRPTKARPIAPMRRKLTRSLSQIMPMIVDQTGER